MLTIASNKKMKFVAAFTACVTFALLAVNCPPQSKVVERVGSVEVERVLVPTHLIATESNIKSNSARERTPSMDREMVQAEVQKLGTNELLDRKEEIEKEISGKQLVERYNSHKLDEKEVQALRRLAFEKSLITIKLFELN